jgi:hypothetical protein
LKGSEKLDDDRGELTMNASADRTASAFMLTMPGWVSVQPFKQWGVGITYHSSGL